MKLKSYMKRALNGNVADLKAEVAQTRDSLKILERTDMDNATYYVRILKRSDFGGEDVEITYKGTLEKAVKKAEKKFKSVNKRSDEGVCGFYYVYIILDERKYEIPKECWEYYKERQH